MLFFCKTPYPPAISTFPQALENKTYISLEIILLDEDSDLQIKNERNFIKLKTLNKNLKCISVQKGQSNKGISINLLTLSNKRILSKSKLELPNLMQFSLSLVKNKSMMNSKVYPRQLTMGPNQPRFQDQLSHINCLCYHCMNNTKPIQEPQFPRIQAQNEYQLESSQAYPFLITKMIDFFGNIKIPDTFIAQNGSLIYFNNSKSRIKQRPNLLLSEIKKSFDTRRAQYAKILKSQRQEEECIERCTSNVSRLSLAISSEPKKNLKKSISGENIQKSKQMKQIGIIKYKNNFDQILTQSCLGKYLAKRKNDPFWQEISSISLIPPHKEKQLFYHTYNYERTLKNVQKMEKIMQKVAKILDQQDNKVNLRVQNTGNNPQLQSSLQKTNQKTSEGMNYSLRKPSLKDNITDTSTYDEQLFKSISEQIIAYFQVKLHIRILASNLKYIIDHQKNIYLTSVQKFIAVNLKKHQLRMVHDRLSTLEQVDNQDLADFKLLAQKTERLNLNNVLADLVADCLQKRKLQLRQSVYKRPSNNDLVKIFKKMFPTFNEQDVFTNINWKNQFKVYLTQCRKKINKIICEDEGIRILNRFDIIFYRTWN